MLSLHREKSIDYVAIDKTLIHHFIPKLNDRYLDV